MCVLLLGIYSDSFMNRLKMHGQIALLCGLSLSLIASILDTFMYRLNMSCQITLLCSLMATLNTYILDTFIYRLNMHTCDDRVRPAHFAVRRADCPA